MGKNVALMGRWKIQNYSRKTWTEETSWQI